MPIPATPCCAFSISSLWRKLSWCLSRSRALAMWAAKCKIFTFRSHHQSLTRLAFSNPRSPRPGVQGHTWGPLDISIIWRGFNGNHSIHSIQ
jgi:hypothetical protein